jgi:lysyl-tRNA synthetase, class II
MQQTTLSDDFIGQRARRLSNMQALIALGINPYPALSHKEHVNSFVKDNFDNIQGKLVTLAGRLRTIRTHGKLMFVDIYDETGSIQVAIKQDTLQGDLAQQKLSWEELQYIDAGDIIEVYGEINKTQRGEITLFAQSLTLLTKTLRPLPTHFDNKEDQFRKRYIDFNVNTGKKDVFVRKSAFWNTVRGVMLKENFKEIFIPVLEHTTGGADAKPFITHYNELDEELYLRISLELYSKRAIGAGLDRVFSIGPVFRNEGMSDEHANEYSMMEFYMAYADYKKGMELTKRMYTEVAKKVYGTTTFTTHGHTFDMNSEWQEIDYTGIIKERYNIDIFNDTDETMSAKLMELGVHVEGANRIRLIDNLWKTIRKTIAGPAFLVNQPKFISPLAKSQPTNLNLTQRFQIILAGSEIGNGYSELNDPLDQLERFREQEAMREGGDDEAQMLDSDFVEMLEYGMPPTCGFGVSERFFWFLENITAREGIMFPMLRQEKDAINEKIYGATDISNKKQLIPASKTQNQTKTDNKTKYLIFDFDGVLGDSLDFYNYYVESGEEGKNDIKNLGFKEGKELIKVSMSSDPRAKDITIDWIRLSQFVQDKEFPLFKEFLHEVLMLQNTKLSIVSSSPKSIIFNVLGSYAKCFDNILGWEDHTSKIEKVKTVCALWNVEPESVWYFTDTERDVVDLSPFMGKDRLIGCAWGFHGYEYLSTVLPKNQILQNYTDIHVFFNTKSQKVKKNIAVAQKYKAVLFDLDGTLLDTNGFILQSLNYVLNKYFNVTISESEYKPYHGIGFKSLFAAKEIDKDEFEKYRGEYVEHQLANMHNVAMFDHVTTLLEHLQEKGLLLGIYTNASKIKATQLIKQIGLDKYMHTILTRDDVAHKKPHPQGIMDFMQEHNLKPSEVLYIGDTLVDIFASRAAGVDVIAINHPGHERDIHQYKPDYVIDSFLELIDKPLEGVDGGSKMDRLIALDYVVANIPTKNLVNHCLATEAAMEALATRLGGDKDIWGLTGLLHDADWDATRSEPHKHTLVTTEWLSSMGMQHADIHGAILSHNYKNNGHTGPQSTLDWALYCVDELTGFIVAVALMTPDKKLANVTSERVLKKFKELKFAAAVDRAQISMCEDRLNIPLEEFVAITLTAMQGIAEEMGL